MANQRERPAAAAARLAQQCVAFVRQKFGFPLPFTPESLLLVDLIVDKIKETRATETQASTILRGLGCYAGEVFVRHAKGSWRSAAELKVDQASSESGLVVALPGLVGCDVIGTVFGRFRQGPSTSVAALYEFHASEFARPGTSRSGRGPSPSPDDGSRS
jgi:hypothetical protein